MKNIFIIILFFGLVFVSRAQRPTTANFQKKDLKGIVIDKDTGQPLEYATISLTYDKRPELIQGGITDNQGIFNFKVFSGKYTLTVEYISFNKYVKKDLLIRESTDLGIIELRISVNSLKEVEVMGERTEVEIRLDKKIYNVGKDITVRGGSVADVLGNVPSVSVDVEGAVSLRGNDNVRILINGKPSGLVGISGPQGLRQLPAESIDKVEVVTSPSARYDAEGTAGILNIILKKQELIGFNGNFSVNAGTPKANRGSASLNWRTNKLNFFTTTTIDRSRTKGNSLNNNEYFNENNPSSYLNEKRKSNRDRNSIFNSLGIEYYISEKSSMILSGFYRTSENTNFTNNDIKELSIDNNIESFIIRTEDEDEKDDSFQYSLDYDNNFDDKGHKISARIQYEESSEDEIGDIESSTILPTQLQSKFEKVSTLENQKRVLAQIDYVWPINENTQFELGYRGTFNSQTNDYEVSYLSSDETIPSITSVYDVDFDLSNILTYKEYVNAYYTQFGKKINKFS